MLPGTVPANKEFSTETVNNSLLTGTVPVNMELLTGAVPVNKELLTRTVPVHKELLTERVPVNNLFYFLNGKQGHQGPIQPAYWKISLTFFLKPSLM